MDHPALAVGDQDRSRRLYEDYFGFGSAAARRNDDGDAVCVVLEPDR